MPSRELRAIIASEVARLLRVERVKQNLSMNALAQKSGLSRQMVSYVEEEERNPSLETLLRMTEALGVRLEEVIRRARAAAARRSAAEAKSATRRN